MSTQEPDFDDTLLPTSPQTEVTIPLFSSLIPLEELIGLEQDSFLLVQQDGSYQLRYQQIDTLADFQQISRQLQASGVDLAHPQLEAKPQYALRSSPMELALSFRTEGASYQALRFGQGILLVQVQMGGQGGPVSVGIPDLGLPPEMQDIPAYGGTVFIFNLGGRAANALPLHLRISSTAPYRIGQVILQAAELSAARFSLHSPHALSMPFRDQQLSLALFQRELPMDLLSVRAPRLDFRLVNRGIPAKAVLDITQAEAYGGLQELPLVLQPAQLVVLPTRQGTSDSAQTGSDLRQVVEQRPPHLRIGGRMLLQLPADEPLQLDSETLLLSRMTMQLPLQVRVEGLHFSQTAYQQPAAHAGQQATLEFSFRNALPLGAHLSLRTMREGKVTALIPLLSPDGGPLLIPPPVDEEGHAGQAITQQGSVTLAAEQLQKLLEAEQVVLLGSFFSEQHVWLHKGMQLQLSMYLQLQFLAPR